MTALTLVQLVNLAMIRLGKDPVTSLTSPTTEEEVSAAALTDHVRQVVLSDGTWSFSLRRVPLDTDTSYSKFLGTGDRTDFITVTSNITWDSGTNSNLVNGSTVADSSNGVNTPATISVDDYILFDFGIDNKKKIDVIRVYAETGSSLGEWTLEGSNDNSIFTEAIVGTLDFTSSSPQTLTVDTADVVDSGYRYWKLRKTDASVSVNKWITEVEFKLASGAPEGLEYAVAYDVDSSVLRVLNLGDAPTDAPYVFENNKILSDNAPSWAMCVVDITAQSKWTPLFEKCYYLYLAHELAYHFRADRGLKDTLMAEYKEALSAGQSRDSQQSSNRSINSNDFIKDR